MSRPEVEPGQGGLARASALLRAAWLPTGIALVAVAAVCLTLNHYGLTYDEGWYLSRSVRAREWAKVLLTDPGQALSDAGIERSWAAEVKSHGQVLREEQPGAAKLVDGLLGYPLGLLFGGAFPERAGTSLFLGACLAAMYLLLAPVWGRAVGVVAAGALLLMPRVFADAHLCTLDVPVMSTTLVTVALMFAAAPRGSLVLGGLSGLAWGVALSCKINALFIPLILAVWVLLFHWRFAPRAAACLLVGGAAGFVLTWPWLWHHPASRLAAYLAFHLHHYFVAVSYFGVVSAHQPWHYPLVMTAVTTPPVTLLLGLAGIALALRHVRRPAEPGSAANRRRSLAALLLLGALFTIGFNCLPNAPKYTGVRLFLPFFAFLACLAAIGLGEVANGLCARLPLSPGSLLSPRRLRAAVGVLALLPALRVVVATHPFQLSYYNRFIGGVRGAEARGMEVTYWGDSYLAACSWLLPHLQPGDEVWVDLPGCQWIIEQYLRGGAPEVRFASGGWPGPEASWAIVQNKASELSPASRALLASGPPRFAARLDDVPLSLVYGRDQIARARAHRPVSEEGKMP